jgi:oligopeptide transport system substrate-binding protein
LREEAKWSDGVAITADDCVCAFQHLLSPQIANSVVWFAYGIKGAEAYNHGKLQSFEGVGVKALDKHVFEVTLNQPSYHFLNLMTYMAFAPIPAHQVLKSGGWSAPHNNWDYPADIVSSGPFRIFKHIPNEALVLEKNPHYWNAQSVDLQGITFFPIGNALTEEQAFLNDQLHITYALPINRLPYYEKYG